MQLGLRQNTDLLFQMLVTWLIELSVLLSVLELSVPFKTVSTRFYTGIDCKTAKNGDEISHFRKKTLGFILLLITFFAQQIWVVKVHHLKAHKIHTRKKCVVNLSKFFLGIAKILQDYVLESLFNKVGNLRACNFIIEDSDTTVSLWNLQIF